MQEPSLETRLPLSRQSLVTPFDLKRPDVSRCTVDLHEEGRQSLVTPFDWKRYCPSSGKFHYPIGRQSLVTPIDWKPAAFAHIRASSSLVSPILGDAY